MGVKDARILAQATVDNAGRRLLGELIAPEIYDGLPVESARRAIEFARKAGLAKG